MSLSTTQFRIQYSPNGSTTDFAFPYLFLAQNHLRVTLTTAGVDAVLTLNSDYTVDGEGEASGGTVTFSDAPASGTTLTIERVVPLTQEVDYVTNDGFPSESHETALDKLTMAVQQVSDAADRSIKVPATEVPAPDMTLPSVTNRKTKAIGFNSSGDLTTITLDPASGYLTDIWVLNTTLLSALDDAALQDGQIVGCTCYNVKGDDGGGFFYLDKDGLAADADGGMTFPSLSGYLWHRIVQDRRINVKWYGAAGDGTTDDQPAIQAALDGLIAHFGGGELYLPKGEYLLETYAYGNANDGGHFLMIGNQVSTISGIQIYGLGATLKQAVDPGASAVWRQYTTLAVYDGVEQFNIEGVDFYSAATTVITTCYRNAVLFQRTDAKRPFKQIKFYNCTFRNHMRGIFFAVVDGDTDMVTTTFRYQFVHIDSCKFTFDNGSDSGGDLADVAPEVSVLCYENCDNIMVTNCYWNGCLSDDISGNTNKRPMDGFLFLRAPTRVIVTGNVIERFDKEGIFIIGNWSGAPKTNYECIISNNIVNGFSPTGAVKSWEYGIRADVPWAVIEGNVISNIDGTGIQCTVEGGVNYPYEVKIINNQIGLGGEVANGTDGDFGVYCNYSRAVIRDNTIWTNTYTGTDPSVRLRGVYLTGIHPSNTQSIVCGNKFFSETKLAAGGKNFVGVEINQGATGTLVLDNVFRNINTGIAFTAGSSPRATVDENEFINLDNMADGTFSYVSFRRNRVTFTPTQDGWYRIGVGAFGFRGRFTVATELTYGDPSYVERRTTYAEFTALCSCNNSGVPTHIELIQHAFTYWENPAFSAVRVFDVNNIDIKIEALGDFGTDASPITVVLESSSPGIYPQFPTLNTDSGYTYALLNFGQGARVSDRDNSGTAIDNLIKIGSYFLWVDGSGVLRIKDSSPTSLTDGTIVGMQT